MPSLITLRQKSRYLKNIEVEANRDIRPDEITAAQTFADYYIEGKLGTTFDSPNIPELISQIADMVASSRVHKYVFNADAPKESDIGDALRKEADELLREIKEGSLGLKMSDDSFHPDFPGDSRDIDENTDEDELDILL